MGLRSSGEAVLCAPRQRALGPSRVAAWSPRAPPGRPEFQLEPPDQLGPPAGPALPAINCRVKTFQYIICQSCLLLICRVAEVRGCGGSSVHILCELTESVGASGEVATDLWRGTKSNLLSNECTEPDQELRGYRTGASLRGIYCLPI